MEPNIKKAIEQYQCSGCVSGCDTTCFQKNTNGGIGCGKHLSGTIFSGIGNIFLGLPKGFNRLGKYTSMKPSIFETFESGQKEWEYDKWNIPTWKYLS